jgi:hypothetical protein
LAVCFISFTFYIIVLLFDKLPNIFPIELEVCKNKNQSNDILPVMEILWIILHSIECIAIFILVIQLRKVKDEFNIRDELLTVGSVWLGFEVIFIFNINFMFMDPNSVVILDLLRNFITVLVSGLLPIIKSFQSLNLPICTTKECASNFNLLLITEKTYNAFYDYLKSYMPEGAKFLSFYTELNVFKHSKNTGEVNLLSTDIYEKYLDEKSDMYINFPDNLVENIHKSYLKFPKNVYTEVFDGLGEYAYNTLRDYYYPNFKMSKEFKNLENDLEKDEIIYSRLVASSMISSLEIE